MTRSPFRFATAFAGIVQLKNVCAEELPTIAAAGPEGQSSVTVFPLVARVSVLFVRDRVSLTPTIALPGAVNPLCNWLLRFVTTLVEATDSGAVPVATVDTI